MATNSNYMGLVLWSSGSDPYDHDELVANWNKVDAHDHSSTKGKQIPTAGLADGAVTAAKIAAGTITSDKLSAGAVSIADGSITKAKLAGALYPSGTAGPSDEALRAIGTSSSAVVAGNDARLTDSRTPLAHAASHKPSGSDSLYRTATGSVAMDGNGTGSYTWGHGLGAVPSHVSITSTNTALNFGIYASWDGTNVYMQFVGSSGFATVTFSVCAFR